MVLFSVMVISTLNMEQLYLREDRQRRRRGEERRETDKEDDHEKDGEGESQVCTCCLLKQLATEHGLSLR